MQRPYHVLILCTGNSARSIMGEALFNTLGAGRFRAFSAGSHPTGRVNPFAIEQVKSLGYPVENLRSKSWDEFARPESPPLDFVFTVCDNAAGEVCPVWPGQPITAHWGVRDPVAFEGSEDEKRRFFYRIFLELDNRVKIFTSLPFGSLDRMALTRRVAEIGKVRLKDSEGGEER